MISPITNILIFTSCNITPFDKTFSGFLLIEAQYLFLRFLPKQEFKPSQL